MWTHPWSPISKWKLQMYVPPGLRVPFQRPDLVLRRWDYGEGVRTQADGGEEPIRHAQMPTRTRKWIGPIRACSSDPYGNFDGVLELLLLIPLWFKLLITILIIFERNKSIGVFSSVVSLQIVSNINWNLGFVDTQIKYTYDTRLGVLMRWKMFEPA